MNELAIRKRPYWKPVMRYSPSERIFRIGRLIYQGGPRGSLPGRPGGGYSAKLSLSLEPRLFGFAREHGSWAVTLFGIRVHHLKSFGGWLCSLLLLAMLAAPALAQSPADLAAKLDKASPATLAAIAKLLEEPAPKPEVVLPPGEDWEIAVLGNDLVVDLPPIVAVIRAGIYGPFQIIAEPPPYKPEVGKPYKPTKARRFVVTVTESDLPIPPPVPPTPEPPGPGPNPPPVPVPAGKRNLLIIHESTKDTPAFGGMVVGLRNGAPAEYLKSKGHRFYLLDDNDVNMNGKPTALVEKWRPHLVGMKLPVVVVLNEKAEIVHKQELPEGTTPTQAIDILKSHGG